MSGRPKGIARKTSDAARIRKVLATYGCSLEVARIRQLCCTPRVMGPKVAVRFRDDKALSVKISQERSKMILASTGVARKGKGRMSKVERELVAARLRITQLEGALQEATA